MSFIPPLPPVGSGITMHQCRRDKVEFTCPMTLQAYNQLLGYVELVDFDKNWWQICQKGNFNNGTSKDF